jgi:hypothetical protein
MSNPLETLSNRFDSMTPGERLRIAFEQSMTIRRLLADLIRLELGDVSDQRLKWEVALRLYGNDLRSRELLMQIEPEDEFKEQPPRRSVGLHTLGIAEPELIE